METQRRCAISFGQSEPPPSFTTWFQNIRTANVMQKTFAVALSALLVKHPLEILEQATTKKSSSQPCECVTFIFMPESARTSDMSNGFQLGSSSTLPEHISVPWEYVARLLHRASTEDVHQPWPSKAKNHKTPKALKHMKARGSETHMH